jgi:4-hydroxymandelate oxidase
MPIGLAPMAYQRLAHPDGEVAAASAAREAGVVFVASVLGSRSIEDVAAVGAQTWFQLYWLRDRGRTVELLQRAEASGCRALVVTVDVPTMGRRLRDMRNSFVLPDTVIAANLTDRRSAAHGQLRDASAVIADTAELIDPAFRWDDLEWIRERTELPMVLKGILAAEDATRAADIGMDAVVVSNHGGRQLDGAVPSLTALPAVLASIGGRCPVFMDGGIRTGVDVLKALACGASGVLLGRPVLWGLATGGTQGVAQVLEVLRAELENAMVLTGCAEVMTARRLEAIAHPGLVNGSRV